MNVNKKRKYDWRKDITRNNRKLNYFLSQIYLIIRENFEDKESRSKITHGFFNLLIKHSKKLDKSDDECLGYLAELLEPDYLPIFVSFKYKNVGLLEYFDLIRLTEFMAIFDRGSRLDLRKINHLESFESKKLKETKLIAFLLKHSKELYI